jgi:hypothetical protein
MAADPPMVITVITVTTYRLEQVRRFVKGA